MARNMNDRDLEAAFFGGAGPARGPAVAQPGAYAHQFRPADNDLDDLNEEPNDEDLQDRRRDAADEAYDNYSFGDGRRKR